MAILISVLIFIGIIVGLARLLGESSVDISEDQSSMVKCIECDVYFPMFEARKTSRGWICNCLLYTSDAADE